MIFCALVITKDINEIWNLAHVSWHMCARINCPDRCNINHKPTSGWFMGQMEQSSTAYLFERDNKIPTLVHKYICKTQQGEFSKFRVRQHYVHWQQNKNNERWVTGILHF